MDKEIELRIEKACEQVMSENGGSVGIFNPFDVGRIAMIADVCPKLVKQYFMNQILG